MADDPSTTTPGGADRPAAPPSRGLARAAGLVSLATSISRVLGLAREVVFAALFGASAGPAADAFTVAFRIPNLLRDLFAEGALSAAFVPTITRTLARDGREAARRLASAVFSGIILVAGGVALLGMFVSGPLARLFAPGFAAVPGKLELTAGLTAVLWPFLPLVALAAAAMGLLNACGRFFLPALAPALFNVGMIVCAVALAPLMPGIGLPPIYAMAVGALVGGAGQFLVQWPALRAESVSPRVVPRFWAHPGVREIARLMAPATVGLAATQVNLLVTTVLASSLAQGAATWLTYAFRVIYLPIGLFGVAVGTAAAPAAARAAAAGDPRALARTVADGLRLVAVLTLPAAAGLLALADPVVALLYERGAFLPADTAATAAALRAYALGLTAYSAVKVVVPAFYALGVPHVPVQVSFAAVALNIAASLALRGPLGHVGLALAVALTATFNVAALLVGLRRRVGPIGGRRVAAGVGLALAASVLMAAASVGIHRAALSGVDALIGAAAPALAPWGRAAALLVAIGASAALYLGLCTVFRLDEAADLRRMAERLLRKVGVRRPG
ncbi:MAG TPA: murein biosynthesis integral membrane protein MurJ [Thermodesulfobacteriota bacterium]